MIFVFIFTSNDFWPWKIEERERERARARARRSPMLHQSDDRKRDTERERRETIAPDR